MHYFSLVLTVEKMNRNVIENNSDRNDCVVLSRGL